MSSAEYILHREYLSHVLDKLGGGVVRCAGVNFFLADDEAAGQEVFDVDLHVFPRYVGDGFRLVLPTTYSQRPERTDLDVLAEKIRSILRAG